MDIALDLWFRPDSDHDRDATRPPWRASQSFSKIAHSSVLAVSEADEALGARVRAGDEAAFQALYIAHYPGLAEYVAGILHDNAAAHDVVQDLFLNVWRGRAEWVPGHIAAYLYRAARNRALNVLGAAKRRERLIQTQSESVTVGTSEAPLEPDEDLHVRRFRDALDRAIQTLADNRREIATLRWRHGKSLAEIATITGSSLKAVSMSLARTRATLQPIVDTYLRDG